MLPHFTNLIMDLELKDKVILVSGGAKGIGAGITKALAAEGAIPVIVGRNTADNDAMINEAGRGHAITAELADPNACKSAVEETISKFKRIDGLVNNAGVNDGIGLENGNYESFMSSLHKNLVHYYMLAHFSLPYFIKSKGSIVNISSKTAETGQGNTSAYAASNGGRNALTREWAVELLKYGSRVNAVVVAECFTPLYEKWLNTLSDPQKKRKEIE